MTKQNRTRRGTRVLTVRQPHASRIENGTKTVELRKRSTPYRGPVLILAGAQPWRGMKVDKTFPRGVALCVVDLVDCRPATPSDETAAGGVAPPEGWFAWELRNPRPVTRVPVKGGLGLNVAHPELLERVGLQPEETHT